MGTDEWLMAKRVAEGWEEEAYKEHVAKKGKQTTSKEKDFRESRKQNKFSL